MAKPRIGITRGGQAGEVHPSYQRYHDRVLEAGGEPVDLYPGMDDPAALAATLDGLLVSGGPDVSPARYGAEPHPTTEVDLARDDLEFAALDAALALDLPVLAICRGEQLLNVALGGGLLQHIEGDSHRTHLEGELRGQSRWHNVQVTPGTKLAGCIGAGTLHVNSRHHQAVLPETLAPGVTVSATSPDGLIEGFESPTYRWVVGVQWHPEREEMAEPSRGLFQQFVAACASTPAPA